MDPIVLCLLNEVVLLSHSYGVWQCEFQCGETALHKTWVDNALAYLAINPSTKAFRSRVSRNDSEVVIQQYTIMNTQWFLLCKPRTSKHVHEKLSLPDFTELIGLLCEQRFQGDKLTNSHAIVQELNQISCGALLLNRASGVTMINRQARSIINNDLAIWQRGLYTLSLEKSDPQELHYCEFRNQEIVFLPTQWRGSQGLWQLLLILPKRQHESAFSYSCLTPSEIKLCRALCREQTPASYAKQAKRSIHTVRSQIQRVYRKLGVNRLNQLVQKLTYHPTDTAP